MKATREFSVRRATGTMVTAPVLVDPVPFSPRYDLDRVSGRFSRSHHPLRDETIKGRILAAPGVQGGVAGGWAFLAMRGNDVGPKALIFGEINPVMVQGAVTAGITVVAGIETSFFESVLTGETVLIDPAQRVVKVISPSTG